MLQGKNPLLIALVLGVLAGLFAYSGVKKSEKDAKKGWNTVRILCANQNIPEGTELTEDMVAFRSIPEKFITNSFIVIPDSEKEREKMAIPFGQRVLVPLKAGDPILISHFESAREAAFSSMIEKKGRAIAINVDEAQSVGSWVRPNDHVDVIFTLRDPDSHDMKTITLLQNVIVLATGKITANTTFVSDEDKSYRTVTLLVLPEEAEMLVLAQKEGEMTLSLRNPEDLDVIDDKTVTDTKTLLTGERATLLRSQRQDSIQIIRGVTGTKETRGAIGKAIGP